MTSKIPNNPFNRIALCCSGGGYRAASFHLGSMSYLEKLDYNGKPLLESVVAISTVSGGTISGVIYALHKQRGDSFKEIYDFILYKLNNLDLIKEGLVKLNPGAEWSTASKRKNLINAFAEIYDREFTEGETFKVFDQMNSHLETVIFNATEFDHGLVFRFQNEGVFGNYYLPTKYQAKQEVKLSDIIAASSCFTAGFEPILWPHDFFHKNSPNFKSLYDETEPTGLMDGGIYDNQGIDSVITTDNRKGTKGNDHFQESQYDLIIVSDVTSPYMNPFSPKNITENEKGFRAHSINSIIAKYKRIKGYITAFLLIGIILLLLIPMSVDYSNHWITGAFIATAIIFTIILTLITIGDKAIKNQIQKGKSYINRSLPEFFRDKLSHLEVGHYSFGTLEPLLIDRISSVFTLAMDVFLKIVRRLNYGRLYETPRYYYRLSSNLIREITEKDYTLKLSRNKSNSEFYQNLEDCPVELKGEYEHVFGPKLKAVAEEAVTFGTTLWFTEEEKLANMLDKLLACGQFNMCHNLLVYMVELKYTPGNGYEDLDNQVKNNLDDLFNQCMMDWKKFKENPMFMVEELRPLIN